MWSDDSEPRTVNWLDVMSVDRLRSRSAGLWPVMKLIAQPVDFGRRQRAVSSHDQLIVVDCCYRCGERCSVIRDQLIDGDRYRREDCRPPPPLWGESSQLGIDVDYGHHYPDPKNAA